MSTRSPSWAPPICLASHCSWDVTAESIPATSERRWLTVELMSRRLSSVASYCALISPITRSSSPVLPSEEECGDQVSLHVLVESSKSLTDPFPHVPDVLPDRGNVLQDLLVTVLSTFLLTTKKLRSKLWEGGRVGGRRRGKSESVVCRRWMHGHWQNSAG